MQRSFDLVEQAPGRDGHWWSRRHKFDINSKIGWHQLWLVTMIVLLSLALAGCVGFYLSGPLACAIALMTGLVISAAFLLVRNAPLLRDDPLLLELLTEGLHIEPYAYSRRWAESIAALAGGTALSWLYVNWSVLFG